MMGSWRRPKPHPRPPFKRSGPASSIEGPRSKVQGPRSKVKGRAWSSRSPGGRRALGVGLSGSGAGQPDQSVAARNGREAPAPERFGAPCAASSGEPLLPPGAGDGRAATMCSAVAGRGRGSARASRGAFAGRAGLAAKRKENTGTRCAGEVRSGQQTLIADPRAHRLGAGGKAAVWPSWAPLARRYAPLGHGCTQPCGPTTMPSSRASVSIANLQIQPWPRLRNRQPASDKARRRRLAVLPGALRIHLVPCNASCIYCSFRRRRIHIGIPRTQGSETGMRAPVVHCCVGLLGLKSPHDT
ncbi:hypothetical protein P171DRAFT_503957 [Karstenula rhodostoma CBS 690.94]|uniref:Uncharacterized protein n=1 Tax=Karstenula rhodostoma CBS 690.94 TaxID=1392251 RepID=A0A9P4UIX4_9PLEO|nr:hypothetical protein P171DRAFT_503957 [Karstenula rhodostoma CBS 690.94]